MRISQEIGLISRSGTPWEKWVLRAGEFERRRVTKSQNGKPSLYFTYWFWGWIEWNTFAGDGYLCYRADASLEELEPQMPEMFLNTSCHNSNTLLDPTFPTVASLRNLRNNILEVRHLPMKWSKIFSYPRCLHVHKYAQICSLKMTVSKKIMHRIHRGVVVTVVLTATKNKTSTKTTSPLCWQATVTSPNPFPPIVFSATLGNLMQTQTAMHI